MTLPPRTKNTSAEAARDLLAAPLQEGNDLVDDLVVLILGAEGGAGADAALDVVVQAGTGVFTGDGLGAGAPGEELLHQVKGAPHGAGGGVGAEVAGAIVRDTAGGVHAGALLAQGDLGGG